MFFFRKFFPAFDIKKINIIISQSKIAILLKVSIKAKVPPIKDIE